jgi:hypothetical protein
MIRDFEYGMSTSYHTDYLISMVTRKKINEKIQG